MSSKAIDVTPGQSWTVDAFRPEDGPGVAALFLSVYGEGYPIRTYLEPALLIEENAKGRILSSVARTSSGAVIGHVALFNSAPNPRIFESGAGLVHKLYRGGDGIFTRMVRHCIEIGRNHPQVDLVFGEPVCNHSFSQKMLTGQGFVSSAMEVNLMPAQAYTKEESAEGRVSTLLGFLPLTSVPGTVYVPSDLKGQFSFCYKGLGADRAFETAIGIPEPENSVMNIQPFDFAAVARIAVSDVGKDFSVRFAAEESALTSRRIKVFQVWLNTGQSCVHTAVQTLMTMGYFFGGVLPCWFGTDGMLMQKVLDVPDWEDTVLEGKRNRALGEMIKEEWTKASASGM